MGDLVDDGYRVFAENIMAIDLELEEVDLC